MIHFAWLVYSKYTKTEGAQSEVNSMADYHMGEIEARFADIIWENEPISSGKLVALCREKLNWSKGTTYTVLRKLCHREIFKNENSTVTSLISRADYYAVQSERFVEETYQGSLPAFVVAFASRKKLSRDEIEELQRLLNTYGETKDG